MKKLAITLMISGLFLLAVSEKDLISFLIEGTEIVFFQNFHAPFFGSFAFRAALMIVGGIFLLTGAWLYKKYGFEKD